jgi:hypothetical protein
MRLAPLLFAPALLLAVVGEEWSGTSTSEKTELRPDAPVAAGALEPKAPLSELPLHARR